MIEFNEEYHHHVPDGIDDRTAICGERIFGWHYASITHAFLSVPVDYIQPCPNCVKKIIEVFEKAE